ncbi:SseB family protein [Actinomadura yumaensis]|uniref:SseB family protein n=1 Tax=Actinomadura yumaensis TaxID=111807 RepID=UPI00361BA6EA
MPAGEAASGTLPTITIGGSTYATVFTSPEALGRNGGRQPYRRTTFAQLSTGWPDPSWQLAINPGLPSEIHLDAAAIARLDANQRAATPGIDPKDPFGPGPARPTLGPVHSETPPRTRGPSPRRATSRRPPRPVRVPADTSRRSVRSTRASSPPRTPPTRRSTRTRWPTWKRRSDPVRFPRNP